VGLERKRREIHAQQKMTNGRYRCSHHICNSLHFKIKIIQRMGQVHMLFLLFYGNEIFCRITWVWQLKALLLFHYIQLNGPKISDDILIYHSYSFHSIICLNPTLSFSTIQAYLRVKSIQVQVIPFFYPSFHPIILWLFPIPNSR
jgi:hypothetical protein